MEDTNINFSFSEIQLPELLGFEDSLMNYFEDKAAKFTDTAYLQDTNYLSQSVQY